MLHYESPGQVPELRLESNTIPLIKNAVHVLLEKNTCLHESAACPVRYSEVKHIHLTIAGEVYGS